jgi:hypothetical protein
MALNCYGTCIIHSSLAGSEVLLPLQSCWAVFPFYEQNPKLQT